MTMFPNPKGAFDKPTDGLDAAAAEAARCRSATHENEL
jgi:hypothetical protein